MRILQNNRLPMSTPRSGLWMLGISVDVRKALAALGLQGNAVTGIRVREFADKSPASAASPDYVKFRRLDQVGC